MGHTRSGWGLLKDWHSVYGAGNTTRRAVGGWEGPVLKLKTKNRNHSGGWREKSGQLEVERSQYLVTCGRVPRSCTTKTLGYFTDVIVAIHSSSCLAGEMLGLWSRACRYAENPCHIRTLTNLNHGAQLNPCGCIYSAAFNLLTISSLFLANLSQF
jgi:hypothetical protein